MNGLYYQIIRITDFGPYVTRLILAMPTEITAQNLNPAQFNVFVDIRKPDGETVQIPKSFTERDHFSPCRGYRVITAVYPCSRDGIQEKTGHYVCLELSYGPTISCSSALAQDFSDPNAHEYYTICDYRITQTSPIQTKQGILAGLVFDTCAGIQNLQASRFQIGCSTRSAIPMKYGCFFPEDRSIRHPLILFLHGAGEGGWDTPIAWSGNKVTEFTEDWIQQKFGGAVLLVPQCPTMWMDDGSHQYGDSGTSMYTESLMALVEEFIKKNESVIDRNRIYIGGDSNGGFMTMRMILSYPHYFAAAFPICEAMIDERITGQDIELLKSQPIWFVHSSDDPIVPPERYVLPTYHRLIKAEAQNVHFTYWNGIFDLHEGFKDESGKPYRYLGHFAWIPTFNDDCRTDFDGKPVFFQGREVTLLDWLSMQKKE